MRFCISLIASSNVESLQIKFFRKCLCVSYYLVCIRCTELDPLQQCDSEGGDAAIAVARNMTRKGLLYLLVELLFIIEQDATRGTRESLGSRATQKISSLVKRLLKPSSCYQTEHVCTIVPDLSVRLAR